MQNNITQKGRIKMQITNVFIRKVNSDNRTRIAHPINPETRAKVQNAIITAYPSTMC